MIHRITSTLDSFKAVEFGVGLNVLIADREPESTTLQTRNRAGKSSLIELIHFLTGSDSGPHSLFRTDALVDHEFSMSVDVGNARMTVGRSGRRLSRIRIAEVVGDEPDLDRSDDDTISVDRWKTVLGQAWFGLPADRDDRYSPTFRSLFSYFVRRDPGGFLSPFKHFAQQGIGDQQVAIAYLLGLDWTIAADRQRIRDQESALRSLREAAASGLVPGTARSAAQLRTLLAVAEQRRDAAQQALSTFRVLPQYEQIEEEASEVTRVLNDIADSNTTDMRRIDRLQGALESEQLPDAATIEHMYEEARVLFSEAVRRRIDEVRAFHVSIASNRRLHLERELTDAEERIRQRNLEATSVDRRRAELLAILSSHGALANFTLLQQEANRRSTEVDLLRQEFEAAAELEGTRTTLAVRRADNQRQLHTDLVEREAQLRRAIVVFGGISSRLYDDPGSLEIGESPNGPEFKVTIQGGDSRGVRNMEIFCMDMTLAILAGERQVSPGFLIHDSHLFDGVDERQVGGALAVGNEAARANGFQYIVTMNSDALPQTVPDGFVVADHVLPTRLTDRTEDGGLFGIRF